MSEFAAKESARQSPQPSGETMAAWLFDNGYGYVDAPRFMLNHVYFYATDFWPEHKEILQRKIDTAREWDSYLTAQIPISRSNEFDPDSCNAFLQPLLAMPDDTPEEEALQQMAVHKAVHATLDKMQAGELVFFKPDSPERERGMHEADRAYFIHALKAVSPDILEYMIRKKMPIQLQAFMNDELGMIYQKITSAGIKTVYGMNTILSNDEGLHSRLVVGGASLLTPACMRYYLRHEVAHDLVIADPQNHLSAEEWAAWESAYQKVKGLMETGENLANMRFRDLIDDAGTQIQRSTLHGVLLPNPKFYPTESERMAEVFCDILALSFTHIHPSLEPQIRTLYAEHPQFADALFALRDVTRGIFDDRLHQLRDKNPLPESLTRASIAR